MEARIETLMDLVFELKQDVAALKGKSSTEPEPTNKTWIVTVPKVGATSGKTITYKLTDGGEDQPVASYTVGSDEFSFEIEAPKKPTIFSVSYDTTGTTDTISSGITVTEKQQ